MRINQNISAMNTYSRLTAANTAKSGSLAKLSSGLRINKAGDDAAGLAISEKMRGQVGGLKQAIRNAQDGISLIQTAEGALTETHSILNRMRELAVQASNGTNTIEDRDEIQKEMNQLTSELNRVGNTTEFNTQKLLNGEKTVEYTSQSSVEFDLTGMTAGKVNVLGLEVDFDSNVADTATAIKDAIEADGELAAKYTVTANAGKVTIETIENGPSTDITVDLSGATDVTSDEVTRTEGDSSDNSLKFQIGANSGQSFAVVIEDMRASALGLSNSNNSDAKTVTVDGKNYTAAWTTNSEVDNDGVVEYALDISTHDNATAAIGVIDEAINSVSSERSKLGSYQNRLDHTINNLTATAENLSAAESRIRDVDMAEEMMEFTKNNILSQAATSMLAQANQMPQSVLQLLQ